MRLSKTESVQRSYTTSASWSSESYSGQADQLGQLLKHLWLHEWHGALHRMLSWTYLPYAGCTIEKSLVGEQSESGNFAIPPLLFWFFSDSSSIDLSPAMEKSENLIGFHWINAVLRNVIPYHGLGIKDKVVNRLIFATYMRQRIQHDNSFTVFPVTHCQNVCMHEHSLSPRHGQREFAFRIPEEWRTSFCPIRAHRSTKVSIAATTPTKTTVSHHCIFAIRRRLKVK